MKKTVIIISVAVIVSLFLITVIIAKKYKLPFFGIVKPPSVSAPEKIDYDKILKSLTPTSSAAKPEITSFNSFEQVQKEFKPVLESLTAPQKNSSINKEETDEILKSLTPSK